MRTLVLVAGVAPGVSDHPALHAESPLLMMLADHYDAILFVDRVGPREMLY